MPIFDQGYQHWQGKLSGHAWRWLAITRQGVRAQMKNRWLRMVMLFAWLPAIALAGVLIVWGLAEQGVSTVRPLVEGLPIGRQLLADPLGFRPAVWGLAYHYFFQVEMFFAMVLVLLAGPNLISRDLRFNAFPLYFARPLRRIDYFMGKLGVIAVFLSAVAILPAFVAYLLGVCFSLDLKLIVQMLPLLLSTIAYGAVIVFSAGLLMLALSSLSRNSRYVAAFWVGVWFITSAVSGVVGGIRYDLDRRERMQQVFRAGKAVDQQFWMKERDSQAEFFRNDWSSMISYTANLQRIGRVIMNTDAAWEKWFALLPGQNMDTVKSQLMGPLFPWYWSALVLAGLAGLSVWILTLRVKSLDRLR
jgi:ABC-2 type transport system permease protein